MIFSFHVFRKHATSSNKQYLSFKGNQRSRVYRRLENLGLASICFFPIALTIFLFGSDFESVSDDQLTRSTSTNFVNSSFEIGNENYADIFGTFVKPSQTPGLAEKSVGISNSKNDDYKNFKEAKSACERYVKNEDWPNARNSFEKSLNLANKDERLELNFLYRIINTRSEKIASN